MYMVMNAESEDHWWSRQSPHCSGSLLFCICRVPEALSRVLLQRESTMIKVCFLERISQSTRMVLYRLLF